MAPGRGEWVSTTNERRKRPMVTLTLSPDAKALLQEVAAGLGLSLSELVELLAVKYARKLGAKARTGKK